MSSAAACRRKRRRRSSSATVERLMDTCGTGVTPPAAFARCRGPRPVRGPVAHGQDSDCPADGRAFALWYSHRGQIPNMILWLCRKWKIAPRSQTKPEPRPPRILALDFGAKSIGLAVSDELGLTAQGLPTLLRSNKRNDFDHLRRIIRQYGIAEIVMGLPLRMSGERRHSVGEGTGIRRGAAPQVQAAGPPVRRATDVSGGQPGVARNRHEHSPPRRSRGPAGRGADSAVVPGVPKNKNIDRGFARRTRTS